MNIQSILFSAAEYAIIFPGIFICLVPVSDWLIIPQKKIYTILIPMVLKKRRKSTKIKTTDFRAEHFTEK